eukprot:GHVR01081869.1.p1 GENE.GHVR01081869.1~~GHVR01081869.1.p1  ORF type:complete len:216 (-),score=20.78 GHVR01081869.1:308-955(-)
MERCRAEPDTVQKWTPVFSACMEKDMRIRYEGPPAGIHGPFNVFAAIERMRCTIFSVYLPGGIRTEYNAFKVAKTAYETNRLVYHEGAKYIMPDQRKVVFPDTWSQETREVTEGFVRICMKGSSMARAKAGFERNDANTRVMQLRTLFRAMMMDTVHATEMLKLSQSSSFINPLEDEVGSHVSDPVAVAELRENIARRSRIARARHPEAASDHEE